jgi:hypothetical protein
MLRRLGDRGEGAISYLVIVLLVGAIAAAVTIVALPDSVSSKIQATVCDIARDNCDPGEGGNGGDGGDARPPQGGPPGQGDSPGAAPAGGLTPEEQEYQAAQDALTRAERDAQALENEWDEFDLLEEIARLGLDFIAGDIIACIENPNLGDCLWALIGLVPWGKIGKLLKSIPKVIKLIDRFLDLKRRLDKARKARKDARDRLDRAKDACDRLRRGRGGNSFPPGTPVLMADGTRRPIEHVRVGDHVWATDPNTGRSGPRPVTDRIVGFGTKELVDVTVDSDGLLGGPTALVTATANHPFWVPGTRDWIAAGSLVFGDGLATSNGRAAMVVDLNRYRRAQRVHNLTVAGFHTYHVGIGATEALVHNDPPSTPGGEGCDVPTPGGYQTPTRGTPEYDQRVDELAQDPSHQGQVGPKARREAEVGLELERRGDLKGPIRRAPKINGRDTGEFVDADGQHWDIKAWADTFPAGPRAGQPMPPGTRGRYSRADVENQIRHELSQNPPENVIVDPANMSPQALADVRSLVASHPEWQGKVIFL